jgi:hypothetical protein
VATRTSESMVVRRRATWASLEAQPSLAGSSSRAASDERTSDGVHVLKPAVPWVPRHPATAVENGAQAARPVRKRHADNPELWPLHCVLQAPT